MKLYQSHKQVHAAPMSRGEYSRHVVKSNHSKMAKPSSDGFPDDPGYLVIYNKDTVDHYESWSPKHVFDDGYTEVA